MHAFEGIVAQLLWEQGYWVQQGVYVDLTKEEKRSIGRHSSPRWELDVVAFRPGELLIVECKSFLDSPGVGARSVIDSQGPGWERYKLFHDTKLREVVSRNLLAQLKARGSIKGDEEIVLALACGKVKSEADRKELATFFTSKNGQWRLFDDKWVASEMGKLKSKRYENSELAMVAKILLR